ncbi:MAG TPA: hypothetical protein VIK05_11230 [Ilumatobacteraceae bacterium]
MAGRKPLHTTYSNSGTVGVDYYPTYSETVNAMALQAERLTSPGAQILFIDADGNGFDTPDVSSILENRDVVTIRASTSAQLVDTIRDAEAADAAAVVLAAPPFTAGQSHAPNGEAVCDDLVHALDNLGMRAAVIVDTCAPRDGWYKLDVGLNLTSPDLQSGALPIATDMPGLGDVPGTPAIRTPREVGALLAVIRVINQLGGPAKATPESLDKAMREFTGPVPLGAGPLDCTPTGKVAERVQPGSCVRFVDVHQFVHDQWIDQAPIDLGA